MWMSSSESWKRNSAPLQLASDRLQPAVELGELVVSQHADLAQGLDVGPGLIDVVGRQPPVELDRAVEPPEARVGVFAEASHDGKGAGDYGWPGRSRVPDTLRRCGSWSPARPARWEMASPAPSANAATRSWPLSATAPPRRSDCPPSVTLVLGDVTEPRTIAPAVEGVDGVFNCMGIYEQWLSDPGTFERVNAQGARNVVAAAREAAVGRVVHTSTFDVFHAPPRRHDDRGESRRLPEGDRL